MGMVIINEQDKAQVAAILNTHAEMQDQRSVGNLELMSNLQVNERDDDDACALIHDLEGQNVTLDGDCDNLRRIAKIFS